MIDFGPGWPQQSVEIPPRPESPKEKAELQKRVNSLVDKWAVQHAERLKAAKRRRTQSK
jgi:hypothetical protein